MPPSTGISTQSGSEAADGDAPGNQAEPSSHDNEEGSGDDSASRKESIISKPETMSEVRMTCIINVSLSFLCEEVSNLLSQVKNN